MEAYIPRILLGGTSSGTGKTLITCGLLQALKNRKLKVTSFKCGPDYIDPMFHKQVLGTSSGNLDTFFTENQRVNWLLAENARESDLSVIEGVMGYFDGISGMNTWASAYDVAVKTLTPSILIVNAKGMSLSVLPIIKGFLDFEKEPRIKGIILNQVSPMIYSRLKADIEEEVKVKVVGYVPNVSECNLESRHLGLVMPNEIKGIQKQLQKLSEILEKTLDLDAIIEIAKSASPIKVTELKVPKVKGVRIGIAKDEAFCFTYYDNIKRLEESGVTLVPFSPIHDKNIPKNIQGLLLNGGYPELYAKEISENLSMKEDIKRAIKGGLPCIAECGGFMYLQEELIAEDGISYPMVGVIPGSCENKGKLSRFGYVNLYCDELFGEKQVNLVAHEFHYYESTHCGNHFHGKKPLSSREWDCGVYQQNLLAGFSHFYYYGNEKLVQGFLNRCKSYL